MDVGINNIKLLHGWATLSNDPMEFRFIPLRIQAFRGESTVGFQGPQAVWLRPRVSLLGAAVPAGEGGVQDLGNDPGIPRLRRKEPINLGKL